MTREAPSNTPRRRHLAAACLVLAAALFLCVRYLADSQPFLLSAFFPALVAVLMLAAGWADRRIRGDSQVLGVAKWLLAFSLVWLLALLAFGGVVLLLTQGKSRARAAMCREAMSKVLTAMQTYTAEAAGCFPPASSWHDALAPVLRSRGADMDIHLLCPEGLVEWEGNGSHEASYAFNRSLSTLSVQALGAPEHTVAILESDAGRNAAGGPELLPDEPRHSGGDNYGFADGRVQWIKRRKLPDGTWAKAPDADWLIWEPVVKEDDQGATQ